MCSRSGLHDLITITHQSALALPYLGLEIAVPPLQMWLSLRPHPPTPHTTIWHPDTWDAYMI